jgi:hypothetical protein
MPACVYVAYLSDILVSYSANLLNICRTLRNTLQRVAAEDQLVLLCLGDLNVDARVHDDPSNNLLANEVSVPLELVPVPMPVSRDTILDPSIPDLNLPQIGLLVLLQVDVDGEMGVDVSHLVSEALRHANDHVVDQGSDCSQGGDILARAVVDFDRDNV